MALVVLLGGPALSLSVSLSLCLALFLAPSLSLSSISKILPTSVRCHPFFVDDSNKSTGICTQLSRNENMSVSFASL
jgi:hypothetical protein